MKRTYIAPVVEIYHLRLRHTLLAWSVAQVKDLTISTDTEETIEDANSIW